ncbi:TPA: bifunctional enoyl-CoA hydratase/phosphate acetyltransferase [Burkholderia contaminans]|uniref:bifunctional enoyl-CoA hydratase/phosphate acetyltransferase n=1 Tax=Burkholderia cepacia complex TaxID=87882 RepID=UPI0007521CB4|nr:MULTISPECIES: bifunctional enoyl-CoA hydratase/phosphate acetyltransferase [Burkholderia cepacia complex]KVS22066.1 phosphate acetyltransferase [Burkholderia vietnamiensis]MBM6430581.1 bifunctional enoyl-CoA hydratase/phosphate acetyltransferase [Burkholderia contaminans]MCA7880836.1 bifunctional enoyl-CoA hydratase/phosphate acetyltransferase [Burkholderia contaminans]MDN8025840.1 bifunctional enoyl-CoA hydratase/phosphate acetyltransferase [Burkholderia contaminans]PRG04184.1 phosphate ac
MQTPRSLHQLVDKARSLAPIRVAVAGAEQDLVIETMREAQEQGWIEPRLVGVSQAIQQLAWSAGWRVQDEWIAPAESDGHAAAQAVELVRRGAADVVMKGRLHTDTLMHALLDAERGLRVPGLRVSHLFVIEVPSHSKLLGVTDAAVNITPDLNSKAQILQNAIDVFRLIGIENPKVAILSAVETVNPAIVSTLDAACLTLMARRGQLHGAIVDGPLAFDNAISAAAAAEKGIVSEVAGDTDLLLVPDLVSGNILVKDLTYLAGSIAAGVVAGLSAPVVLTSRADSPAARLASLALAALMFHGKPHLPAEPARPEAEAHPPCAPTPESACCPPSR